MSQEEKKSHQLYSVQNATLLFANIGRYVKYSPTPLYTIYSMLLS